MRVTTSTDWLTNIAASCLILFSLTGSAVFIGALMQMSQHKAPAHKVLLPAQYEQIQPMPARPLLSDPVRSEPMPGAYMPGTHAPGATEEFERSRIMASYQAMHSIYN